MKEVFYLADYTVGAQDEVNSLQKIRGVLMGSGPPPDNVFLIGEKGPPFTGGSITGRKDLAMDRIVNHLAQLNPHPTRINLVGHFGSAGLVLHRRSDGTCPLGDGITDDLTSWIALRSIASVAGSSAPHTFLGPATTLRLLGCSLLASPPCDGACDGPLMAQAIARTLCCNLESVDQGLDGTHFEVGKLSSVGTQILRSVGPFDTLAPKTCCPGSKVTQSKHLPWLPYAAARLPGPKVKSAHLRVAGTELQRALPSPVIKGLNELVGWDDGRYAPGLLQVPETILEVQRGAVVETMVVVAGGQAVWLPSTGWLYPLAPQFVDTLSAATHRGGAEPGGLDERAPRGPRKGRSRASSRRGPRGRR